jgi:hypothetical protein
MITLRHSFLFRTSLIGLAAAASVPANAREKLDVGAYLEYQQVFDSQFKGPGPDDTQTYSTIAAGVEASINGERAQGQIAYRYEYRYGWGKDAGNEDVHSGLARGAYQLVPNKLSIEAGALATRTRFDGRGGTGNINGFEENNVTQAYSGYVGPTYQDKVGPVQVGAAYRLAYSAVEADDFTPGAGQQSLGGYDDSVTHIASASIGMEPGGELPFGWQVSGAFSREDTGVLDQRFESKGVEASVTVPIAHSVAALGRVGYEDIQSSQRSALLDSGGNPVVDNKGRFVSDRSQPRLLSYDFDGIYWDAGLGWKPSRRTAFEAHVGRRYGSMSYTGSFTWQPSSESAFQIGVYDEVTTFGQQLNDALSSLPTNFRRSSNPFDQGFSGCTFSGSNGGSSGGGSCLNSAFQSVNGSVFRSRGVSALYAYSHGRFNWGVGAGYAQRKYRTPTAPGALNINGVQDESWYGQANFGYQLDRNSTFDASAYVNYLKSGLIGSSDVLNTGVSGAYSRSFNRRLSATLAAGLFSYDVEDAQSQLNASGLVGLRYDF